MRRIVNSSGFVVNFARRCSTDAVLEEIFSELGACDVVERGTQPVARIDSTPKNRGENLSVGKTMSSHTVSSEKSSTAEQCSLRMELSKKEHLQRQLREVRDRAAMTRNELIRKEEAKRHARYVVSPPAMLHLSTAELVQEGSPQCFVPAEDSSERLPSLPRLKSSGNVAVVTLVGRVLSPATLHSSQSTSKGDEGTLVDENGPYARLLVEYKVPFLSAKLTTVQVRCYGATLSSFAAQHVREGDLVHVLGHLLPIDMQSPGDPTFCICALPVGGNISVVLGAECDFE
uniref:Uncharacterized protein n=1 Tax=Trypanosoma congolense (strain IL3000) TaxID=1068625 RepID=G0UNI5_TRYCI|nr:conserved hypothetical protein [Trypanosoma congolense IL3000]